MVTSLYTIVIATKETITNKHGGQSDEEMCSTKCEGVQPGEVAGNQIGSQIAAGKPGVPRLVTVTSGSFSGCILDRGL